MVRRDSMFSAFRMGSAASGRGLWNHTKRGRGTIRNAENMESLLDMVHIISYDVR